MSLGMCAQSCFLQSCNTSTNYHNKLSTGMKYEETDLFFSLEERVRPEPSSELPIDSYLHYNTEKGFLQFETTVGRA